MMSNTIQSPNEYTQIYQHSINEEAIVYGGGGLGATTSNVVCDGIYSPSNSYPSSHQICPSKGCGSKPIRRRSRASKKTPITLLNANANNFRALVQQFTGCPSTALSFGSIKGPVNLNFEQGGEQNHHQHANSIIPAMVPSAYSYNYNQQSQIELQQQHKYNQLLQGQQEQQFQEVYHGQHSAYSVNSVEFPDNFPSDNINLSELIDDSFLNDNRGL